MHMSLYTVEYSMIPRLETDVPLPNVLLSQTNEHSLGAMFARGTNLQMFVMALD